MNNTTVSSLSILTSSKCNLNCNFCFLNKNKTFNNYNEIINKAWEEHSYIPVLLKVLLKLKLSPKNIVGINLWGGETLYNLQYFISNIKELYLNFPNINEYWISTNFSMNIENLINLLVEIDTYALKKTNFRLLLSIDGPYEIAGHKVPKEIYDKNFRLFFDTINNIRFNNLSILIMINSVIDEYLYLEYFDKDENIINYLDYMEDICSKIKNYNRNQNVIFNSRFIFPRLSHPSLFTKEDGLKLNMIYQKWNSILYNNYHVDNMGLLDTMLTTAKTSVIDLFSNNHECGMLKNNLCILPDGTIAECINHYLILNEQYQAELLENGQIEEYNIAQVSKNLSYNPLKMTDAEVKYHFDYITNEFRNNMSTYRCLALGVCLELLKSKLIDESYADVEKLYSHIVLMLKETNCSSYNLESTYNSFLPNPSEYRKLFNGVADLIFNKKEITFHE